MHKCAITSRSSAAETRAVIFTRRNHSSQEKKSTKTFIYHLTLRRKIRDFLTASWRSHRTYVNLNVSRFSLFRLSVEGNFNSQGDKLTVFIRQKLFNTCLCSFFGQYHPFDCLVSEIFASILSFSIPVLAWQHLYLSAFIFNFLFSFFDYAVQLYDLFERKWQWMVEDSIMKASYCAYCLKCGGSLGGLGTSWIDPSLTI